MRSQLDDFHAGVAKNAVSAVTAALVKQKKLNDDKVSDEQLKQNKNRKIYTQRYLNQLKAERI